MKFITSWTHLSIDHSILRKKENPSSWGRPCEKDCYKIMEETAPLQSSVMNFDGSAVSFRLYINSNHLLLDAFPDFLERK